MKKELPTGLLAQILADESICESFMKSNNPVFKSQLKTKIKLNGERNSKF